MYSLIAVFLIPGFNLNCHCPFLGSQVPFTRLPACSFTCRFRMTVMSAGNPHVNSPLACSSAVHFADPGFTLEENSHSHCFHKSLSAARLHHKGFSQHSVSIRLVMFQHMVPGPLLWFSGSEALNC